MRYLITFAVLVALLATHTPAMSAEVAPDWTMMSAEGEEIRLDDEVREQTVVLYFWATWCPYCRALMTHLQSIRYEFGDDVKILAVQVDDKGDPVAYMNDGGYDFTVLPGGSRVAGLYEVYSTPGLLIIDKDREIRFDLRDVPGLPEVATKKSHKGRAALLAPYWAAIIRSSLDPVIVEHRE